MTYLVMRTGMVRHVVPQATLGFLKRPAAATQLPSVAPAPGIATLEQFKGSLTAAERLIMGSLTGSTDSISRWLKSTGKGITQAQVSAYRSSIAKQDWGSAKALLTAMSQSQAAASLHQSPADLRNGSAGSAGGGGMTSTRAAISRSQTAADVRDSYARGDAAEAERLLNTVAARNAVATLTQQTNQPRQGFLPASTSSSDPRRDAAAELEAINQAQRDRVAAESAEADRLRAAAAYNQDLAVPGAEAPAEWYIEAGQSQIRDPASATQQKTNAGVVAALVGIPIVASLFL
jgi:hypothetical protein